MCGDANVASPAAFDQDMDVQNFEIIFSIWIRPNHKMNRKQEKKRPNIDIKLSFFKIFKIYMGHFFWSILWPKVVQPYSYLKTCCIVNDNKYIPDKAVVITWGFSEVQCSAGLSSLFQCRLEQCRLVQWNIIGQSSIS